MRQLIAPLAVLLLLGSATADARTISYAIVIGNNAPPTEGASERLAPLRYADDDAVRYYQLFSRTGYAHLLAVLDTTTQRRYPGLAAFAEPPTLERLRRVVSTYAAAMVADTQRGDKPVLYFAFSGHGARDASGRAFLALVDAPLTQDVLYDEILARLPTAYSHVLIDACHAGGVVGVRGEFFGKEVNAQTTSVAPEDVLPIIEAQRLARFPHVGVILATTLGQEAHEWSEIESGVFTHELVSGLLGPADVNADGNIEYTEVQAFVAAANRAIKDPRAIPQVIARPPSANHSVPLVSVASIGNARVLHGGTGKLGHFYVELDNGQRYVDAHLSEGSNAVVVIPNAGNAFVRTATHEAKVPAGDRVAFADLRWSETTVAARGSIDSTYRAALFSSAYGRSYYQGYVDSIGAVGVMFPEPAATVHRGGGSTPAGDKRLSIGLASVATVTALASFATTVFAVRAKQDFDATSVQREAYDANVRYERYRAIAIGTGVGAVAAGLASWWLWPRSRTQLVAGGHGDHSIAVAVSW